MADLDALAPNYHRAQRRWPAAPTLASCHRALDTCFANNGHGMVEHVKSFIESVCLTIMGEFGRPKPCSTPSTTDLLVAALDPLGLRNTRGASKLDKVLSGFNKLAEALTEMRNDNGPVAHGRDGFLDAVTTDHARAFLHAGDAILSVLLDAFEGKQPDLMATREPYEHFPHLNERIDRAVSVAASIDERADRPMVVLSIGTGPPGEAIELRVEPSRLLYGIDRSAYVEVLETAAVAVAEGEEEIKQQAAASGVVASAGISAAAPRALLVGLVVVYRGVLEPLRAGVNGLLAAAGLDAGGVSEGGARLAESLLATAEQNMGLDWRRRQMLMARLKVACKRVLARFGCESTKSEEAAEELVVWLRAHAPKDEIDSRETAVDLGGGQS